MKTTKYNFNRGFHMGAIDPIALRLALTVDRIYLNGKQRPVNGEILKSFSLFW